MDREVRPTAAQDAVRDAEGLALLVVAPAGCGKTEALALRAASLVERRINRDHRRILVTTFSNRARDNIRDRLKTYLSPAQLRANVTVANFHGLSARIFKAHASVIGLDPTLVIPESNWVREQCGRWRWSWQAIEAAESALSRTKRQALDDAGVEQALLALGATGALTLERERVKQHRLTYDDLPRVAELLLANEAVASLYRNHFSTVIVDEYQDLTPQQLRIIHYIGQGRTTYAGDLAQGIYGFAGAVPLEVDRVIRRECGDAVVEFSESHRSSPAVLAMVNSLTPLTNGLVLTSAHPVSWPQRGLAGVVGFANPQAEAAWAVGVARVILERLPKHRIGMICRSAPRRRVLDGVVAASGLPFYRWDDAILDTETAAIVKLMLLRLNTHVMLAVDDPLQYLRDLVEHEAIVDPDTRKAVAEALVWCLDLLRDGVSATGIRDRIRVGDQETLLSAPGVHLLSGHLGKGQQFDWVVVVGVEDDVIPDWRSKTEAALLEDARLLSVMISRARHGVIATYARNVATAKGDPRTREPSRFLQRLVVAGALADAGVRAFLESADWAAVGKR